MSKKYGNDHYWAFLDDDAANTKEIAIWAFIDMDEHIIARTHNKYDAKIVVDALIAYKNTSQIVLNKKERAFLDFVKANCPEPYATMAANAILWNDKDSYNKLKNEFPVIYS